jgi:hypothetical protein
MSTSAFRRRGELKLTVLDALSSVMVHRHLAFGFIVKAKARRPDFCGVQYDFQSPRQEDLRLGKDFPLP